MEKESLLINLLNETFDKSTISQIEDNYLLNLRSVSKWMYFSDYCLDDKGKPNDVITFSIIPYLENYHIVENFIKENAKTDLKKTQSVNKKFMKFLRKYPLINFSFILTDRKTFYGNNNNEIRNNLKNDYISIKEQYELWIKNEPERKSYYQTFIRKIDSCIRLIDHNKKVKQLIDVVLIPLLGGYVSSIILNRIDQPDLFGWFSDRDKLIDVENGIALNFFHNTLHGLMKDKDIQYVTSLADCKFDIFYDQYIKIPDYIAGTLADYNLETNTISKEKFNTVLTDYMGDNQYNNFVFRIFKKDDQFHCGKVSIMKK